jgi:UDP-N-acetyl-D-mannosaminouronate:lipid I N-acetyl-D-mannosaminouronosyltransferase
VGGIGVRGFSSLEEAVSAIVTPNGVVVPGIAVAVNPEKVMAARRDPRVRLLLERATLRYPDGIGVVLALRRKGIDTRRVPGCELWERVVARCSEAEVSVFLLGGRTSVAGRVAEHLESVHSGLRVVGCHHGYFPPHEEERVIEIIRASGAGFISVGMGSPRQEEFMVRAAQACPRSLFMGIGGTFDVFLGEVKRAPRLARAVGLEWFYRLASQPTRWRRQMVLAEFAFLMAMGRL